MSKRSPMHFIFGFLAFLSIALIIFVCLFFTGFFFPNYEKERAKTLKPLRIRAVAVGKGVEATPGYGWILYDQGQDTDTLRDIYFYGSPDGDIWHYLGPGDSILKDAGTLDVFVKRKDTVRKFVFRARKLM